MEWLRAINISFRLIMYTLTTVIIAFVSLFAFIKISGSREREATKHFYENIELYRKSTKAAMSGKRDEAPLSDEIIVAYENAVEFSVDAVGSSYYVIVYATSREVLEGTEAYLDGLKAKRLTDDFYLVTRDNN